MCADSAVNVGKWGRLADRRTKYLSTAHQLADLVFTGFFFNKQKKKKFGDNLSLRYL